MLPDAQVPPQSPSVRARHHSGSLSQVRDLRSYALRSRVPPGTAFASADAIVRRSPVYCAKGPPAACWKHCCICSRLQLAAHDDTDADTCMQICLSFSPRRMS